MRSLRYLVVALIFLFAFALPSNRRAAFIGDCATMREPTISYSD